MNLKKHVCSLTSILNIILESFNINSNIPAFTFRKVFFILSLFYLSHRKTLKVLKKNMIRRIIT